MIRAIQMAVACTAMLVATAGQLQAETLTFDDLPSSGFNCPAVPDGYGGFTWTNFAVLDTAACSTSSGYQNAAVSPNNVVFNEWANPALMHDGPFILNSAYFTAAWNDGLNITVEGYSGLNLVHTDTFTVDTTGPTFRLFNWTGIDNLRFSSFGGTPHGYTGGSGKHFAMDNCDVIPEPSTFVLAALGLLCISCRRQKQV